MEKCAASHGPSQEATVRHDSADADVTTTPDNGGSGPSAPEASGASEGKRTLLEQTRRTLWMILTYSWLNVLLVFVPAGIAVAQIDGVQGGVVFAINCIAIVPLAGLLSHATESVASEMGDAMGALLNITFGNAVELIIFIIALVKNQIRIVQASLLGSILSNLLLILGMGFFLGGLRFREQVYNSTVTQMSACLLSLSVISLVLPTAFHASFNDSDLADRQSLKISRGTSVILLLVYVLYLVFQLKSHSYMYESTPQHIVDAEAIPGPVAGWLDSSSEDELSSDSDSAESEQSRDTVRRRMKRMLRKGRRHRPSNTSVELVRSNRPSVADTQSCAVNDTASETSSAQHQRSSRALLTAPLELPHMGDEFYARESKEGDNRALHGAKDKTAATSGKDNESKMDGSRSDGSDRSQQSDTKRPIGIHRIDFAAPQSLKPNGQDAAQQARPFSLLRGLSSMKGLTPPVFSQKRDEDARADEVVGPVPRIRYGIRRTNSLPDRLRNNANVRPPGAMLPTRVSLTSTNAGTQDRTQGDGSGEERLSRGAAVILLLISTGLVAACAEFLVGSIEDVTSSSTLGEAFIGLIILPIVGNAAEHVTALTVAMKNKMDLAIGVAVGSSIQIALFITPLVVILGWILDRPMSLYFTLFETVCLFVSAFIVNFLVLDGRSNYLEGALLCAVYLIIAIVAFFYPEDSEANSFGAS
ncbi:Sodium/calcium exchanger protein-domain-containing protein [Stachybotrys elegans]|uniref:Sodium/calcium exchanger protein-domain-containing protein n=1 Tax=Stachybotrys elegans TaxID=80388 RepID=A0A8K0SNQ8_9HYPO|nr:Sodium/calcium exchanger protein-domain-containing protein [Stachybotrys elegans]